MKSLSILAMLMVTVLAFSSCKKCYECTTVETIEYEDDDFFSLADSEETYTMSQCGLKKKEVEEYESENTGSSSSDGVWGAYTITTTTTCVKE